MADPHVDDTQLPDGVTRVDGGPEDLGRADVIAYLVDHAEFDREAIAAAGRPVLDCRRSLDGPDVEHL